jgi:tRNA(fMet)-specific endonuclease VapC
MSRVAVDTNAVVDYLREDRTTPPAIQAAETIVLPLPVIGELYGGAAGSARRAENIAAVERLVARWSILAADVETARIYGELRAATDAAASISVRRRNDLWIAALCIQHVLPLVSNDQAFKALPGLTVLAW